LPDVWLPPVELKENECIELYPGDTVLCQTKEIISIPADCVGYMHPRSTWLRFFLDPSASPLEAKWRGRITLELKNNGQFNLRLFPHEGICQVQWTRGGLAEVTYETKGGKYQNQTEPTPAKMKG
jgi:deoxycytidine triphosphate deaminase